MDKLKLIKEYNKGLNKRLEIAENIKFLEVELYHMEIEEEIIKSTIETIEYNFDISKNVEAFSYHQELKMDLEFLKSDVLIRRKELESQRIELKEFQEKFREISIMVSEL